MLTLDFLESRPMLNIDSIMQECKLMLENPDVGPFWLTAKLPATQNN